MSGNRLDRRAVVKSLLDKRGDLLVVTGLGSPSYDAMAVGDHTGNCYLWGAMGSAATVGFGLAMAQRDRPVLVLTGDGEMLMGMGAFATIAMKKPPNLTIAVLDNAHYGETGMQASHTASIELAKIAEACSFAWTRVVTNDQGVADLRTRMHAKAGTSFASIKITAENAPRVLPPRDAVEVKNRFRRALGFNTL